MKPHSVGLTFSRRLAFVVGVFTPLAETIRRWNQFGQLSTWPIWFDDLLLGGFLLLRRGVPGATLAADAHTLPEHGA